MKLKALTPEEIEQETLSEEEMERRSLQKALEKYRLQEQMDIEPVVGEERELNRAIPEEYEYGQESDIQEIDYNTLPRDEEEARYFKKLQRLLSE